MDKKEVIGLGIILLTVIITMILVANPISEQRISTLDYVVAGDMWEISEPEQLYALNETLEQGWTTTNGNFICWSEYENVGNTWDVYAYNISDDSIVAVANMTEYEEYQQDNYGDEVVWVDERHGQAEIYYKDLSENLTIRVTWTGEGHEDSPRIWGDYITYASGGNDILYYDIVSNTTFNVMEDNCYSPDVHEDYIVFNHFGEGGTVWLYDAKIGGLPVQISPDGFDCDWAKVFGDTVIYSIYFDTGWSTQMYDIDTGKRYTLQPGGNSTDELIIHASLYDNYMVGEEYYSDLGSTEVGLIDLDFVLFDEDIAILTNSTEGEDVYYPDISSTHIVWEIYNSTTGDTDSYFITYEVAEEDVLREFTTETTYNTNWIALTFMLAFTLIGLFLYYISEIYHEQTGR